MFALEVEELKVGYDKAVALWDVHCKIPKGKSVGIMGPNGAGKSTFLKALLGIVTPLSGRILFLGQPYKQMKNKIAYVPQRSSVDWDFPITAFEVVLMGRSSRKRFLQWPSSADKQAAMAALKMVGMESFADRQISQLSGGQQQRLFIARALVQEAEVYLLDEPFVGVDIATEQEIVAIFDKLKAQGKTLLVVHHDPSTVQTYFDWILLLNTCVIACGPVEEAFCEQTVRSAFGKGVRLLDEAATLSHNKEQGLSS